MVKTYSTTERREEIMRFLYRKGFSTAKALAKEFGVTERTIRRDIEILALTKPIYTRSGRNSGGIFIVDGYRIDRNYFTDKEEDIIKKAADIAKKDKHCLSEEEKSFLDKTIDHHTRPKREA